MDTKWKKWKIAGSFVCFFLGMTLLLTNLIPMVKLLQAGGFQAGADYQETAEFRWYVADRLEELLGIATGGKGWKRYGTLEGDSWRTYSYVYGDYDEEALDRWLNEATGTVVQETVATDIPQEAAEAAGEAGPYWWGDDGDYQDYVWSPPRTKEEYMEEMARNKNLRYAVVYKNELVYTNIEAYEEETGKEWDGSDFSEGLDGEAYNFSLWFNRDGDGKTRIVKDGAQEEIYGNGVYRKGSRWFVPGYTNFRVDASTDDAVIFMAAAREPVLYITGDYSQYGTREYGSGLYFMQDSIKKQQQEFKIRCALLAAAVILLLLSFFCKKEKRRAEDAIAGFLRKIWLEGKLLLLVLLPAPVFLIGGSEVFLVVCFWLLYLLVLEVRRNRGRQKKPLFDAIRLRDLKSPVQKRMVKRYHMALASVLAALAAAVVFSILLFFLHGMYFRYGNIRNMAAMSLLLLGIVLVVLLVCAIAGLAGMGPNRKLAEDIGALSDQIAAVRAGNLTTPLAVPKNADLARAAENLNGIQRGLEEALREQMHSERMKVELLTNVSHDIKTPLTAIISYVELLKQEEELPVHVQEFVQILWEKSQRLKTMVQDVFEVSKAAAGQLPVKLERLDLGRLLRQVLADMDDAISDSGLRMKVSVSEEPLWIQADGQRLYRVFQNLLQNALKYSLAGSRIYLAMEEEDGRAVVYLKNTSGTELRTGVDFAERFVRGDASRTDGGSGLGLSIAKSFTEACGGSFKVQTDADLFTVVVAFPSDGHKK